ncbi:unnamed protein product, partial [Amoebophrya sp. A25]
SRAGGGLYSALSPLYGSAMRGDSSNKRAGSASVSPQTRMAVEVERSASSSKQNNKSLDASSMSTSPSKIVLGELQSGSARAGANNYKRSRRYLSLVGDRDTKNNTTNLLDEMLNEATNPPPPSRGIAGAAGRTLPSKRHLRLTPPFMEVVDLYSTSTATSSSKQVPSCSTLSDTSKPTTTAPTDHGALLAAVVDDAHDLRNNFLATGG